MACKVKVFDEEHEEDLEVKVNRFLASLEEIYIIDIKYQVAMAVNENGEQIYCFSAMILYRA